MAKEMFKEGDLNGTPPDILEDDISIEEYGASLAKHVPYYLLRFNRFRDNNNRYSKSWNWACFLAQFGWFLYRKMYKWAFINFLSLCVFPFICIVIFSVYYENKINKPYASASDSLNYTYTPTKAEGLNDVQTGGGVPSAISNTLEQNRALLREIRAGHGSVGDVATKLALSDEEVEQIFKDVMAGRPNAQKPDQPDGDVWIVVGIIVFFYIISIAVIWAALANFLYFKHARHKIGEIKHLFMSDSHNYIAQTGGVNMWIPWIAIVLLAMWYFEIC